ncbi:MAG: hypothetical protein KME42_26640 [Tildeniella nuda ZEHNDER 1965/U140]|nr:hypothetical protein [Tildeniella nuda ZEHNDER 1965/U140]
MAKLGQVHVSHIQKAKSFLDEILVGDASNNVLNGENGNDIILGNFGDDIISSGQGIDVLIGGQGDDQLFGEKGDDVLFGDEGNDQMDVSNAIIVCNVATVYFVAIASISIKVPGYVANMGNGTIVLAGKNSASHSSIATLIKISFLIGSNSAI